MTLQPVPTRRPAAVPADLKPQRSWRRVLASVSLSSLVLLGAGAHAQLQPAPVASSSRNLLSLAAQAEKEVPQDWLTITLSTTKEGKTAAEVQQALRQDIDAALSEAKSVTRSDDGLRVRTGRFSLYPRHNSTGRIASWQGSAEVVLEGRDFEAIGVLAGRINALTVGSVEFSLSPAARAKAVADLEGEAIDQFRARAQALSVRFGFKGYELREVAISDSQQGQPVFRPQVGMMAAKSMADSIPVEAGKASVTVQVAGSVEMRP